MKKSEKNNPWWLFWGIFAALLSLLLYNIFGERPTLAVKEEPEMPEAAYEIDRDKLDIDPENLIRFTQKTVCRRHIQHINMMVELWYIRHDGRWPRPDMGDISADKDYFPNGVPACQVNGEPYRLDPETYRVIGHDHSEIQDIRIDDLNKSKKPRKEKREKHGNRDKP